MTVDAARAERCYACDSRQVSRLVKRLTGEVSVTRCPECHVNALHPMPSEEIIRAHYDRYYLTRSEDERARDRLIELHGPIAQWLVERLARLQSRVLDYGFGSGSFLIQMARRNQITYGADVSRQNVEQLTSYCKSHGLQMQITLVENKDAPLAAFEQVKFDLVTLFQVIEHLTDPLDHLRRMARLQPKGGLVYLECPNDAAISAWAKRFTRLSPNRQLTWGSLKYPEHLHGFSRRAMTRMLEAAGYQVEECGDYAYRDGFHQVEAEVWWPRWSQNRDRRSLYGLSRSLVPLADRAMSSALGAGSGLYALGRKMQ